MMYQAWTVSMKFVFIRVLMDYQASLVVQFLLQLVGHYLTMQVVLLYQITDIVNIRHLPKGLM